MSPLSLGVPLQSLAALAAGQAVLLRAGFVPRAREWVFAK